VAKKEDKCIFMLCQCFTGKSTIKLGLNSLFNSTISWQEAKQRPHPFRLYSSLGEEQVVNGWLNCVELTEMKMIETGRLMK